MKTVIVIGDLNLDVIFSQIDGQPAFGREIGAGNCTMKPGGSAANTAILLVLNGCPVFAGEFVVRRLQEYGVRTDTISFSDMHATGTTVSLAYKKDSMYITFPGTISSTGPGDLKKPNFSTNCHLHLASFFLQTGLRPYFGELLKQAKQKGMTTSLDPGGDVSGKWDISDMEDFFPYIDFFLPNREELLGITEALKSFFDGVSTIIVKAGSDGAFIRYRGEILHYPALPAEPVDTTCAGDSFDAGFLCGISRGISFIEAVRLGNRFGAAAVCTAGLPIQGID